MVIKVCLMEVIEMATKGVFLRAPHNYDGDAVSKESGLVCPQEEGRAMQAFAEECDINEIVRRFGLTGQLPQNYSMPVSGDFTGITDFQSAMEMVAKAREAFAELPGEMRARFENDPQRLMRFLEDEKNREEAIELGLVARPPEKTRDVVQAVDELAAKLVPK